MFLTPKFILPYLEKNIDTRIFLLNSAFRVHPFYIYIYIYMYIYVNPEEGIKTPKHVDSPTSHFSININILHSVVWLDLETSPFNIYIYIYIYIYIKRWLITTKNSQVKQFLFLTGLNFYWGNTDMFRLFKVFFVYIYICIYIYMYIYIYIYIYNTLRNQSYLYFALAMQMDLGQQ